MDREEMTEVARGWGQVADEYTAELFDELERKPGDRALLASFAALVPDPGLEVLDLGCGPGHVTRHVAGLGVRAVGVDLSSEMIEIARTRSPDIEFRVGDMLHLDLAPTSIGGALAMYSLINVVRDDLGPLLTRLASAIRPGGPLLVATHEGEGTLRADELFGHPIPMAATLYGLDELVSRIENAGFEVRVAESREPIPGEARTRRVYVLAVRAASAPGHAGDSPSG